MNQGTPDGLVRWMIAHLCHVALRRSRPSRRFMENHLSRREYIRRSLFAAFAGVAGLLEAGCGTTENQAYTCTDTTALTAAETKGRDMIAYADVSPDPNKTCSNCQLFRPAAETNSCGRCELASGPFHPRGYCPSWVKKIS
jgi:hypothetical protein